MPVRISAWSSPNKRRAGFIGLPLQRQFHADLRALSGLRVDFEVPVHKPHPLLHGRNTEPRGTRQRINRKSGTPVLDAQADPVSGPLHCHPGLFGFAVLGDIAQAFLRHLVQTESDFTAHGLVQAALGELNLNSLAAKVFAVCAESRGQPLVVEFGGIRLVGDMVRSRPSAHEPYPSELEDLGLAAALRAYCEDFRRQGIKVEFTERGLHQTVSREIAFCLYKVAQEGLRNVAKHGKSKQAWVTVEGAGDRIRLRVEDRGSGFPVDSLAGTAGLGIPTMKKRVRLMNGNFEIH